MLIFLPINKSASSRKKKFFYGQVLIVFGRLNDEISASKHGRSFSVYTLALMPENVIEIKDERQIKIE